MSFVTRLLPKGYQQLSLSSAAIATLTVPAGAQVALITVSTNAVRFRDDGSNPSTTTGVLLPVTTAGLPFEYAGALAALAFSWTGANATIDISYYAIEG